MTVADLQKLADTGERLYAKIQQEEKLPEGEFIAINCERGSEDYGASVHAPLAADAAKRFRDIYGSALMWLRQIDWSINFKPDENRSRR